MKDFPYGELNGIRNLSEWIRLEQCGNDTFAVNKEEPKTRDLEDAEYGLNRARDAMKSGEYEIIILDEICVAIHYNLLKAESSRII